MIQQIGKISVQNLFQLLKRVFECDSAKIKFLGMTESKNFLQVLQSFEQKNVKRNKANT
jgi:hypothetical protein